MPILNKYAPESTFNKPLKLSPNQTFTLTEKCCPGGKETCKYGLSVFLRCSAESGKKLDHLHANSKILYMHNFAVCIKLKTNKQMNTDVWQSVWGMAPTNKEKFLPECKHCVTG